MCAVEDGRGVVGRVESRNPRFLLVAPRVELCLAAVAEEVPIFVLSLLRTMCETGRTDGNPSGPRRIGLGCPRSDREPDASGSRSGLGQGQASPSECLAPPGSAPPGAAPRRPRRR